MNRDERLKCLTYIDDIADMLPSYTGRLCAACGYDPYPDHNEPVTSEMSICSFCKAQVLAIEGGFSSATSEVGTAMITIHDLSGGFS